MYKRIFATFILIVLVVAAGWLAFSSPSRDESDQVRQTVTDFGSQLQKVSLLAPDASTTIEATYAPFVATDLLMSWEQHPEQAPGRMTSSPWPDHIEISQLSQSSADTYMVDGSVVLMTSDEVEHGGNAGTMPVTMTLQKMNGLWMITSYQQGNEQDNNLANAGMSTSTATSVSTSTQTQNPSPTNTNESNGNLVINSITPAEGPVGTKVTITGSGFDKTSQVVLQNGAIHPTVNAAGTMLTFTMPDSIGAYCKTGEACPMYAILLKSGQYDFIVKNDDGRQSNSVRFTLTGSIQQ